MNESYKPYLKYLPAMSSLTYAQRRNQITKISIIFSDKTLSTFSNLLNYFFMYNVNREIKAKTIRKLKGIWYLQDLSAPKSQYQMLAIDE